MPLARRSSKKQRSFDLPVSNLVKQTIETLRDALNVFSNQGRLETRFGRSLYLETLLGGPVLSLSYFKTASNVRYLIAKVGTSLYSVSPTGSHTAIKTGLSAGTKHRGITWARGSSSRHIISVEGDGLFQWDGSEFTQLGQNPPVDHTVSATTGTLPDSTYRVHLTYYSSTTGFESNSSYSDEIVTTTDGILVSDLPLTADNATIDKLRIYLEDVPSGDLPLFVAEVPLGTIDYSITEEPTSTQTCPLANAMPLAGGGKFLAEFNSCLVYAGNGTYKNDVYFSEPDLPDAFNDGTAPNRVVLFAGGNGDITGIATGLYNNSVLDPYLVVFKKRSTEIYSEINGEGRSVVISREIGCVSHETIKVKNGNVYFLSDQGWREIENGRITIGQTGNPATLGLGDVDNIFRQPGFDYEVNRSQLNNAFSVYYSTLDQYITWVPEGASTDLLKAYNYEFRVGGFKPYKFYSATTAACVGEDADGDEVVFMGDANGAIYTHSTKESRADDDSTGTQRAIDAFAMLTWLDGDDMDASYNFREMLLRRVSGAGDMTATASVNFSFDTVGGTMTFENAPNGFQLDVSQLDVDSFGQDERSIVTARADINQCGENILLSFYQNEIGTNIGLVSAQIDFNKNGNRN